MLFCVFVALVITVRIAVYVLFVLELDYLHIGHKIGEIMRFSRYLPKSADSNHSKRRFVDYAAMYEP